MRDYLNLLDNILAEANLGANEIPSTKLSTVVNPKTKQPYTRPELFLQKVMLKSPFTLVKGGQVVINPKEAPKVKQWLLTGPKGVITMTTMDGGTVKNTDLQKTPEFAKGSDKENVKVKGSDIFDVQQTDIKDIGNKLDDVLKAGGFPVNQMYEKIATSPAIKSLGSPLGTGIIAMANQIQQGQQATVPADIPPAEQKAIELYASEYLGVMGLPTGATPFMKGKRSDFDKFVGMDLSSMIVYFPKDTANPLADSFSIENTATGHAVKISSKAAGKGAAPSLTSLKFPDVVAKKYPEVAEFHKVAINPSLDSFDQIFAIANWLYKNSPKSMPSEYLPLVPFGADTVAALKNNLKKGTPIPKNISSVFSKRISEKVKAGKATDGGKCWYTLVVDVMNAVNKNNALPNFQAAAIEALGYNFIQIYSNIKGDKLVSEAFWPGMVDGVVVLKTKAGATDPYQGKLSFQISYGKDVDESVGAGSSTEEVPLQVKHGIVPTNEPQVDTIAVYGRKRQR